jgi:DNA-binding NtrC family response regulator
VTTLHHPTEEPHAVAAPSVARTRVLVVDDDPTMRRGLTRLLEARGFDARAAEDGDAAVQLAMAGDLDVLLVDLHMPRTSGMDVLERVKSARADVEVVMMTAYADIDSAVTAVKAGAYDFLTKPFPTNDAVAIAVAKAAEHKRLVGRTLELERELEVHEQFGDIIGNSPRMREVFRIAEGVAASTSTVLILGESGTGKELVAHAIHQRSTRADRPLVVVNCGAIPAELVESELFGHTRGAFTGATMAREGLFEAADGGTIFLDEIGDLPLPSQVKLLRTLQDGEVKRIGSNEAKTVDVRVIAATNVDLRTRIREGKFREDLYYRLNVISFVIPPLRERVEDIPLLATHFLRKYARRTGKNVTRIDPDAMRALQSYPWPGNVRELENAIERAVVLAHADTIALGDLPFGEPTLGALPPVDVPPRASSASQPPAPSMSVGVYADLPYTEARRRAVLDFEREYAAAQLARAHGNISQAARAAGLDRSNFKRVLRRLHSGSTDDDGEK